MEERSQCVTVNLIFILSCSGPSTGTGYCHRSNRESVPGASIQVKGGTQGTISDLDGKFSLNVPNKKSVLVISFIGYTTQELPVDVSKPMSIVLKEEYKNVGRSRCRWLSGGQEERHDRCCGKGKYGRFA